jgi:hypothetical protein
MKVHFTLEREAQLAQLATKAGTDAEHLILAGYMTLLRCRTFMFMSRSW